jgi:hypothetical protein
VQNGDREREYFIPDRGSKNKLSPPLRPFPISLLQDINDWNKCVQEHGHSKCVRLYNPQQVKAGERKMERE